MLTGNGALLKSGRRILEELLFMFCVNLESFITNDVEVIILTLDTVTHTHTAALLSLSAMMLSRLPWWPTSISGAGQKWPLIGWSVFRQHACLAGCYPTLLCVCVCGSVCPSNVTYHLSDELFHPLLFLFLQSTFPFLFLLWRRGERGRTSDWEGEERWIKKGNEVGKSKRGKEMTKSEWQQLYDHSDQVPLWRLWSICFWSEEA